MTRIDPERFATSYYKCRDGCMSHDYHLRSARQIIADYEATLGEDRKQALEAEGYEFWEDNGDGIVGRGPNGWVARQ